MKKSTILTDFSKYVSLNVLGMIAISCYILADTFFVAQGLGTTGLAALNLAIPVYSFIHGCGLMLGMGGGTKYTILKSQHRSDEANAVFTHTLLFAAGFAFIFVMLGIFAAGTITGLLGADESVFAMCETYLRMILIFSPMFMLNNILMCFVRNDGEPKRAMGTMISGSIFNIIFDYIFIFPLGMGMFGAVLATVLSPVVSILILSPYFIKRNNKFYPVRCRFKISISRQIFACGIPSLITEVSSGIVMIVFNMIILGLQGNVGVAAYGVIANLSLVVMAIFTGIAQGIQPLLSRNYGSGNRENVQLLLKYAVITVLVLSGIIYALVFLGAEGIAAVFNSERDALLQNIAVYGLRIYFTASAFAGFNVVMSIYFTSTDNPRPAHVISLLRGFILIIPLAFLLSALFEMTGVWSVFPVTELCVAVIGTVLYLRSRPHHMLQR